MTLDDATLRQIEAADPGSSTWVSANAGSGKTRVLTDRVARLLLRGVAPEKILCLTYTKAAAAEMQNRLFTRLGAWAMLPDEALRTALSQLGEAPPGTAEGLAVARRLFARAIEAPGGLKIQTIHAFCAALLRRFPLEAGVSPDFAEMDDRAQRLLIEELIDAMAEGSDTPLVEALAAQAAEDFTDLAADIARHREAFRGVCDLGHWLQAFGLPRDFGDDDLVREVLLGGEAELLARLVDVLREHGGPKDGRAADTLAAALELLPRPDALPLLEKALLKGSSAKVPYSAPIGEFPTKAVRNGPAAALMEPLEALMRRLEEARPRRCALASARCTATLHAFAGAFLARYADAKMRRGWLDFDDLILLARALLRRPGLADWVLFRLDGGIDHILVDEAQDTSPEQWEVIRLIAEEFTTGRSARSDVARTLFVVGDLKQSIYSFQGADPAGFERMAGHFSGRLAEVGVTLKRSALRHSFRSAPAVLRAVDTAFLSEARHSGLGGQPEHMAFHADKPGRVDLWPAVPVEPRTEDPHWTDPVDRIDPQNHDVVLARTIADEIARLCHTETGEWLTVAGQDGSATRRRMRPGDVLILVQRRSTLFAELIRACKARNLPIAGADRLRLGGELAVRDLAALLSFLATPEDDLSLAAALRSPLFGWSEDRLFRAAHGRGPRFLWEALRNALPDEDETRSILRDLLEHADFLRPYELLERILTRHDGRRRLLARLGPEAEDGIDALIAQAMGYERRGVPSLTGFLTWMQTEDVEVKRQLDSGGGVVRVMTVHGAKGLEAPVVILPDTRAAGSRNRCPVIFPPEGEAVWRMRADEAPPQILALLEDERRRAAQERMRLLYVAMTRAESWLIVAGAGDVTADGCWHGAVSEAMEASGALPVATPTGPGLRLDTGAGWEDAPIVDAPVPLRGAPAQAAWATLRAPPPSEPMKPLSPSDLGGAKALPGDPGDHDLEAALRRGRRLHRLLEHLPDLPPGRRAAAAAALLGAGPEPAEAAEAAELAALAVRVLEDPACAPLFAAAALVEVGIAAPLAALGGRRIAGAIDRLVLAPDRVLAVDFKTNVLVPARPEAVPEGILRQMGAYAAALEGVYPGRRIETAILWTAGPLLMPLPPDLVAAALRRSLP